jgi:hypothetical protein
MEPLYSQEEALFSMCSCLFQIGPLITNPQFPLIRNKHTQTLFLLEPAAWLQITL